MEGRLLSLVQTSLGAASKSEGLQANDVESLHLSDVFVVRSTKILSFIQDIISSTSGTRQSSSEIKCDDKINFYNCNLCISHLPRSVLLFAQPQYSTTVSQAWQYWGLRNIAETFKHFERERDGSTIQRRSNCRVPGKLETLQIRLQRFVG